MTIQFQILESTVTNLQEKSQVLQVTTQSRILRLNGHEPSREIPGAPSYRQIFNFRVNGHEPSREIAGAPNYHPISDLKVNGHKP